jgi:Cu(I)/Ag(I) efflux system membrane fusion protein
VTRQQALLGAGFILVVTTVGVLGFWLGRQQPSASSQSERQVLYWYDPMVPDTHFDKPGKSPFMDMDLVPRYAGEPEGPSGVTINPGVLQNLGIRVAPVERTSTGATTRASGTLAFNDRALATVQAKQDGFVERSYGRAAGDTVGVGDPLVDVRVPVWSGAIAEYLVLRDGSDPALAEAARRRLGSLGVPNEATQAAERQGVAPVTFTIRAPVSGALVSLEARPGAALAAGAPVATISGLSPVWLVVSVPQGSIGVTKSGTAASIRFPAFPGQDFEGRVDAVLPAANAANRTVEVRIALDNRSGRLRPGMTGDVTFSAAPAGEALTVPSEAVIRTGLRNLVIVSRPDGSFEPVEVTLGSAIGNRLEIMSGVAEGQQVVASGQFLIDSEANLTGVLERLRGASTAAPPAVYESTGRVTAVDGNGVTIAHAPVAALSWPEMTMAFGWGDLSHDIAVGDMVAFSFRKGGAGYVLTAIAKTGAPR